MKIRQDAWTEENDLLLAETVLRHVREGSTQLNAFEEVGDRLDRTSAACGFRWNAVVRHQYDKALTLARKQRKQRQRMLGTDQSGKKKVLYKPPMLENFETIISGVENRLMEFSDEALDQDMMNYAKLTEAHNLNLDNIKMQTAQIDDTNDSSTISSSSLYTATNASHQSDSAGQLSIDSIINYLRKFQKTENIILALKNENERLQLEIKELQLRNMALEKKLGSVEKSTTSIQEDYETLINIMNKARKMALIEDEERPTTKFKMDRNGNLEKLAE